MDRSALSHVRVLDLSRQLPGPYCSRVLADFGAEVIKIERPGGGDMLRRVPPLDPETGDSLLFRALNHGKKCLTLDLKSEDGRGILLQLIETADVLLEGFRPGVMDRLGLGYESLVELNSRLIYCSLTGYGPVGAHRDRAGHDLNFIGLSGLLDLSGSRDGPPVIPGAPIADISGALWAVIGVLLALLARKATGKGQRVDVSMLGGALACLPLALAQSRGGELQGRGTGYLTGGVICYNMYETQDGRYVTLAALEPKFWATFCEALGRKDLLGDQLAPAVPGERGYEELCALFRSRTREEWTEALSQVDACCEPVYSLDEALLSSPVQALGMLTGAGVLPLVRLSTQAESSAGPAPALSQDTDVLLGELGFDLTAVSKLRERNVV